jgi:hypothetical protein
MQTNCKTENHNKKTDFNGGNKNTVIKKTEK